MIQKLIEKLNKKRLKERISSAIVMLYWKKERIHRILMRAMKHSRWHRIRWHRSMRRFIRIW